jgi:hypothetical protein
MQINRDWLILGAVVGGIAAVWTLYDKIKGALDKFGEGAADLVPQGVYDTIAGPRAQVTASVVLPNGQTVSFNRIVEMGGSLKYEGGERYTFTYNGHTYRVTPPRRADGNYTAVRA